MAISPQSTKLVLLLIAVLLIGAARCGPDPEPEPLPEDPEKALLLAQLKEKSAALDALQAAFDQLNSEKNQLEQDLDDEKEKRAKGIVSAQLGKNKLKTTHKTSLQLVRQAFAQQRQAMQQQIAQLQAQLLAMTQNHQQAANALAALQAVHQQLQQAHQQLQQANQLLQQQLAAAQTTNGTLTADLANARGDVARLEQDNSKLRHSLIQRDKENLELLKRIARVEHDLQLAQNGSVKNTQLESDLAAARAALAKLRSELEAEFEREHKRLAQEWQEALDQKDEEYSKLEEQVDEIRAQGLRDLEALQTKMDSKLDIVSQQLKQSRADYKELVERANNDQLAADHRYRNDVSKLESTVAQQKREMEIAEQLSKDTLHDLQLKYDHLHSQMESLSPRVAGSRFVDLGKDEQIEKLTVAVAALKDELSLHYMSAETFLASNDKEAATLKARAGTLGIAKRWFDDAIKPLSAFQLKTRIGQLMDDARAEQTLVEESDGED